MFDRTRSYTVELLDPENKDAEFLGNAGNYLCIYRPFIFRSYLQSIFRYRKISL